MWVAFIIKIGPVDLNDRFPRDTHEIGGTVYHHSKWSVFRKREELVDGVVNLLSAGELQRDGTVRRHRNCISVENCNLCRHERHALVRQVILHPTQSRGLGNWVGAAHPCSLAFATRSASSTVLMSNSPKQP